MRPMHYSRFFATPSLLFCCSLLALAAELPGQAPKTRDSSGIVIVENPSRRSNGMVFRLSDKTSMDLGGLHDSNQAYELSPYGIPDIVRLPSKMFVIPDAYQVKLFDSTGRIVKVMGRPGEGPGEFQGNIVAVCAASADSFVAAEKSAPRFSVYAKSATFVRTSTYDGGLGHGTFRGCAPGGDVLIEKDIRGSNPPSSQFSVLSHGSNPASKPLGVFYSGEYAGWFSHDPFIGLHGNFVYSGDGWTFEYRVYDLKGRLVRIVRTADGLEPFTDADAEGKIRLRIAKAKTAKDSAGTREALLRLPRPRSWPTYADLLVDNIGRVWLSEKPHDNSPPTKWSVFDVTGRLLGRTDLRESEFVRMHADIKVVRWEADDAVMTYADENGAKHICVVPFAALVRPRN